MGAVTALNSLSVFEYNQIGDDDPMINQGVNLNQECTSFPSLSQARETLLGNVVELPHGQVLLEQV